MFRKNKIILVVVLIIISGLTYFGFNIYQLWNGNPAASPVGNYTFEVKSGQKIDDVGAKLELDKAISSKDVLLFQAKLNPIKNLQTGQYTIKLPASSQDILYQIDDQTGKKAAELSKIPVLPTEKITIREGLNIDQMAAIFEEKGILKAGEMQNFAKDPKNFNRTKYPFLPEPLTCQYGDIKNCAKYYAEGYLYPDTYNFFKPSTSEQVFDVLLKNFNTRVWSKLETQAKGKDFYKIVTLASVMEKETGRNKGVKDDAALAELNQERKLMADVFNNRTDQGIKWQSDVTGEYGHGKKLCQQTFKLEGCIFLDDPLAINKYNTYIIPGYPIGPISNPQFDNINAALNPTPNDYLFFVADAIGKKYFSKTNAEHIKTINDVSKINKDLGL